MSRTRTQGESVPGRALSFEGLIQGGVPANESSTIPVIDSTSSQSETPSSQVDAAVLRGQSVTLFSASSFS